MKKDIQVVSEAASNHVTFVLRPNDGTWEARFQAQNLRGIEVPQGGFVGDTPKEAIALAADAVRAWQQQRAKEDVLWASVYSTKLPSPSTMSFLTEKQRTAVYEMVRTASIVRSLLDPEGEISE